MMDRKLWYEQAANCFEEALPIGNGHMGGMVYSNTGEEHISLNEDTLWSGAPKSCLPTDYEGAADEVRRLMAQGDRDGAAHVVWQRLMGDFTACYAPAGDGYISLDEAGEVQAYRRELDLATGVVTACYRIGDTQYTREVFCSYPDDVFVVRLKANQPVLSGRIRLESPHPFTVKAADKTLYAHSKMPYEINLAGHVGTKGAYYDEEKPSVRFCMAAQVHTTDGTVKAESDALRFESASELVVTLHIATDFTDYAHTPCGTPETLQKACDDVLQRAGDKSFDELKTTHICDHGDLFGKMDLHLCGPRRDTLPTDERLRANDEARDDVGLQELLFQYGRYLLIACSRPGSQPANLQGIWNELVLAPWCSGYTLNINLPMNYWHAESTGLSECHQPLLDFVRELAERGKESAKVYGCRGWLAHHNTDLWRYSGLVGRDWRTCMPGVDMNKHLINAKWIWLPQGERINQYGDFRGVFYLQNTDNATMLHISADSRYTVTINGKAVNASQYADYPFYKVYDSIDISELVKPGENVLGIIAYFQGEDSSVYRLGKAGVLFAVENAGESVICSSAGIMCRESRSYTTGEVEKVSPQLSFSFRYNAVQEDNWQLPEYTMGSEWGTAVEQSESRPLFPRPVEMLKFESPVPSQLIAQGVFLDTLGSSVPIGTRMQQAYLSSRYPEQMKSIPEPGATMCAPLNFSSDEGDGIYVLFDLGREEAGLLYLDIVLPDEADVLIGWGEHLDDLRPRTAVGPRQFAALYHGKKGPQTFCHRFKRVGCRYIMLFVYAHNCTINNVSVCTTRYPVTYRPIFRSTDSLHNRIEEISRRTLELCMHEHYEDCPWREQAMYAGDVRNQMLFGYYAFGEVVFAQSALRLLAKGLRPDGLLELCAPARVSVVIPSYSLDFIVAVKENVEYSGDLTFGREMLPVVTAVLNAFTSRLDSRGLVANFTEEDSWNFFEWQEGLDGNLDNRESVNEIPHVELPLSARYSFALSAASALCQLIGETEKQEQYEQLRRQINAAMEVFWDESKGLYATHLSDEGIWHYSEYTQALMICAGAVPNERRSKILERFIMEDNGMLPLTLSNCILKYDALFTEPEKYGAWCIQDIGKRWGDLLLKGATSFWETEKGAEDFCKAGSLCHAWSAVPLYVYHRYVLGERLDGTREKPLFYGLYPIED